MKVLALNNTYLMKNTILYILLGFVALVHAQTQPNFPQRFQQQIDASCKQPFTYEKTLHDLKNASAKAESQTFVLDESKKDMLKEELAYSFEFDASDIKRKGDYTQTNVKDTLIFTRTPTATAELRKQKILYQQEKIRFVESLILKEYWLYTMEMHILVYFDAKGQYSHHFLRMYSKIKGLDAFDTYILGKKK